MDHPAIGLIALASPFVLVLVGLLCRRLYWTEWAQALVLRWTGESRLVATAWGSAIASRKPPTPCVGGGSLVGSLSAGIRRTPARASAPASPSLPGAGDAGSTARPDAPPSPGVHPSVGAGTLGPHAMRANAALPRAAARQGGPQLAATAQCSGPRAAAVDQPAGES